MGESQNESACMVSMRTPNGLHCFNAFLGGHCGLHNKALAANRRHTLPARLISELQTYPICTPHWDQVLGVVFQEGVRIWVGLFLLGVGTHRRGLGDANLCVFILVFRGVSCGCEFGRVWSSLISPRSRACMWAKWGRFLVFPVLCLLAHGDTALKS